MHEFVQLLLEFRAGCRHRVSKGAQILHPKL